MVAAMCNIVVLFSLKYAYELVHHAYFSPLSGGRGGYWDCSYSEFLFGLEPTDFNVSKLGFNSGRSLTAY
jgi:hypothetical protein